MTVEDYAQKLSTLLRDMASSHGAAGTEIGDTIERVLGRIADAVEEATISDENAIT